MKDRIAVIPCSTYQIELIQFLKQKGHEVVGVNPEANNATKLVDEHVVQDIMNVDAVCDKLQNISRIYTDQSDIAVMPVARISEKLGLPYNRPECAELFSCNKYKMYQHAKAIGVPTADFQKLSHPNQLELDLPIVLKPADSTNSRGVYGVFQKEDLDEAFDKSGGYSRTQTVIAQKYKNGLQITVEGICINGKHYTLCHSYKGPYWELAITSSLEWPLENMLTNREIAKLNQQNDAFVESTQIENCITHGEYIYEDGTFFLNEIACRGGGFYISSIIAPHVCGVDFYEVLYNKSKPKAKKPLKSALMKFYKEPITEERTPGVVKVESKFNKREFVKNKDNPRSSYVILLGEDPNDLKKKLKAFEAVCLHHN